MELVFVFIKIFLIVVVLLMMVAFLSLFERKFLGISQIRKGPGIVGILGFFQPFADAMKLVSKINSSPEKGNNVSFFLPPIFFFFISLSLWVTVPIKFSSINFQMSGLFLIFWMSIGVYGLIFSGWFSYSKYSTLGLCRAIVQSISYEIVLTFCIFSIFLIFGTVNLSFFLSGNDSFFYFLVIGIFLVVSLLAESGRTPFDLPEGESELVGGYSVEYGSVSYTILFLGENLSLLFNSYLMAYLFSGGNLLIIKFMFFLILFIWIRSTLPRIRFDKLMKVCWLDMIPTLLGLIFFFFNLS